MIRIVLYKLPLFLVACETNEQGMANGTGLMHHDWTMMGYGWGGIVT